MREMIVRGSTQFPEMRLNPNGILTFAGNSLPNDAESFYQPIIAWIDQYLLTHPPSTLVSFRMIYYNTATSKYLYLMLKRFEQYHLSGAGRVKIVWLAPADDPDLMESGVDYADKLALPFEFGTFSEEELGVEYPAS